MRIYSYNDSNYQIIRYNVHWLHNDKFTIKRKKIALFMFYPINIFDTTIDAKRVESIYCQKKKKNHTLGEIGGKNWSKNKTLYLTQYSGFNATEVSKPKYFHWLDDILILHFVIRLQIL